MVFAGHFLHPSGVHPCVATRQGDAKIIPVTNGLVLIDLRILIKASRNFICTSPHEPHLLNSWGSSLMSCFGCEIKVPGDPENRPSGSISAQQRIVPYGTCRRSSKSGVLAKLITVAQSNKESILDRHRVNLVSHRDIFITSRFDYVRATTRKVD